MSTEQNLTEVAPSFGHVYSRVLSCAAMPLADLCSFACTCTWLIPELAYSPAAAATGGGGGAAGGFGLLVVVTNYSDAEHRNSRNNLSCGNGCSCVVPMCLI